MILNAPAPSTATNKTIHQLNNIASISSKPCRTTEAVVNLRIHLDLETSRLSDQTSPRGLSCRLSRLPITLHPFHPSSPRRRTPDRLATGWAHREDGHSIRVLTDKDFLRCLLACLVIPIREVGTAFRPDRRGMLRRPKSSLAVLHLASASRL